MPTHAGAAVDAVVAALPRRAKRQLRAACRAGRAAVDARVTAIAVPHGESAAGLSAAVARMPRLRSLDCCIRSDADCIDIAGAVRAAPASLAALRYEECRGQAASDADADDGAGRLRALADVIASRPGLTELDLELIRRSPALCGSFVAAVGRLPRLQALRLSAVLHRDANNAWREALPALALPSTLQVSAAPDAERLKHFWERAGLPEPRSGGRPRPTRLGCAYMLEHRVCCMGIASRLTPDTPSCLPSTLPAACAQALALDDSTVWLLPPVLDRGAAALPALASLTLDTFQAQPVVERLFEERGLLARLTRLAVLGVHSLPPLQGAADPEHCPGDMRMEDLEVRAGFLPSPAVDAAALAAWLPRLRRLVLPEADPAALRALLRAPWAAGLEDLHIHEPCLETAEGACGVRAHPSRFRAQPAAFGGRGRGSTHAKGTFRASDARTPTGPRSKPCLAPKPGRTPTPAPRTSGAEELACAPLPGLTALTLDNTDIPDECWPRLLVAPWASRLCRLFVQEQPLGTLNKASGAGLRALARAPLPALVDLELVEAYLRPKDLSRTLATAPWLSQLTRLKLAYEWLGAAGLAALASLRLPRLERLSLVHAATTEAGLVALSAAPWLTRLTRLEVEEKDEGRVLRELGEAVNPQECGHILEGRGFSACNPFAALARQGFIEHEFC
jgi:hypothetical protein